MKRWWKKLGPGLVTGASDDDPAGLLTYTQAGAAFGFGTLWLALFTTPLMIAVQEACARIAIVSRKGLFELFCLYMPRWLVILLALCFIGANVFNLAADLNMMAAAMNTIAPVSKWGWILFFAGGTLFLQVFLKYRSYANVLRWLTIALFSYVLVLFFTNISWSEALYRTIVPSYSIGKDFVFIIIAILGTTLSPYLYVWQASEEVEESAACRREHVGNAMVCNARHPGVLSDMRFDVSVGMLVSNVVFWAIVAAAGATLHAHGSASVETVEQASSVLRPLLGPVATLLFTTGIIGTGLLTIPVLAGSAAYVVAEIADWRRSLNDTWDQAPKFYGTLAIMMVLGVVLNAINMPPVSMLLWSAVVNALLAPPLLVGIIWMANRGDVMKSSKNGTLSNALLTLALVVMTVAALVWAWLALLT